MTESHEALLDELTAETEPYTVVAQPETKLAQLHALYAAAKAEADEAAKRFKAVTDAIKVELTQAAGADERCIELRGEDGAPLRLTYTESWRLDSTGLKRADPETYVRYAKKSGSWRLIAVRSES